MTARQTGPIDPTPDYLGTATCPLGTIASPDDRVLSASAPFGSNIL